MTEEQVEEQIIKLDKIFIENGEGFKKWFENKETLFKSIGHEAFDDSMKNIIEKLRSWAEENGFMEPKAKRQG